MRHLFALTLILWAAACNAPPSTPTPSAAMLAGMASGMQTEEAQAANAQATATQGAQDAVSVNATAVAVGLLVQKEKDAATREAGIANAVSTLAVTSTLDAITRNAYTETVLARAVVVEAAARERAAIEIADREERATDIVTWLIGGLAVLLYGVLGGIAITLLRNYWVVEESRSMAAVSEIWDRLEAGKRTETPKPPVVERHVAVWQNNNHASAWQAHGYRYVQATLDVCQREPVKHPFSEPTAAKYELVVKADSGQWWADGYRETITMLQDAGILTVPGSGGKVEWAGDWTPEKFARDYFATHLPYIPAASPPGIRIYA